MPAIPTHRSLTKPLGSRRLAPRRLTLALLIPAALATLVAMVLLWPHPSRSAEAAPPDRVNGEVTAVQPIDCAQDPEAQVPAGEESPSGAATICGTVAVRLTSGPEAGKDITTDIPAGPGAISVAHGDDIELLYLPDSPDGQLYSIYDHQRSTQLWVLAAAFALAVIARAVALSHANRLLNALREFHDAKVNWWHGDTLRGSLLAMALIADIYGRLRMPLAAIGARPKTARRRQRTRAPRTQPERAGRGGTGQPPNG